MDPHLREGYRRAAALTWRYGTTYFWGAALLPRSRRRHVHAVYALCRLADDIVDDLETGAQADPARAAAGLAAFAASFRQGLAEGTSPEPTMAAVVHTVLSQGIDPECFDRFFGAMAMDLTTTAYETFEDLCGYMEGSAAVIGEMMLPVLSVGPGALAPSDRRIKEPARSLGLAFQLTNFLRDVAEDLDRGRTYVPQADLRRFGVDLARREVTREWRALLAYEIARNRELYRAADAGIARLPPRSARCVGAARVLYSPILDRVEAADYDVFSSRVRVPTARKAATAAGILVAGPPRPENRAPDVRRGRDTRSFRAERPSAGQFSGASYPTRPRLEQREDASDDPAHA
ncbi:MAG: phytoene/squalene synthase family protein [Actinomycetes bacterium]